MLTKLKIENFKRIGLAEIELAQSVVFIGPNNSGKTSALQALALWHMGVQKVLDKHSAGSEAKTRTAIALNRKDIVDVPVPASSLLWPGTQVMKNKKKVAIVVTVEGISGGKNWSCGIEFTWDNDESFYCDLVRTPGADGTKYEIPEEATKVKVNLMPPMSGLDSEEALLPAGRISVLIGQGRTAEVLRNLCFSIYQRDKATWKQLCGHIQAVFNIELEEPEFIRARGEIRLGYREGDARFDLSSVGRGCQQTLLLLAHLYEHSGSVLLLDEPDAHLEILRQSQVYRLLHDVANRTGSQILAASHSEIVMTQAIESGHKVIAFIGQPHPVQKTEQLRKALADLGWEHYYNAEQRGWVLYLEGTTDLDMLRRFAALLKHPVGAHLEAPFMHPVFNQSKLAEKHFRGLREAKPNLVGVAVYDRLDNVPTSTQELKHLSWKKRELENYFCTKKVLSAWALGMQGEDLFTQNALVAMTTSIDEIEEANRKLGRDPWSPDFKASDDFLEPLFKNFYGRLGIYNTMPKSDFYRLIDFMDVADLDPEIGEKLDAIHSIAEAHG